MLMSSYEQMLKRLYGSMWPDGPTLSDNDSSPPVGHKMSPIPNCLQVR